jgi:uncharacterized protein YkuJ
MKAVFYSFAILSLVLGSCKGDSKVEDKGELKICHYSYNENNTTFEWTAYKTTEKIGVTGSFNEIEVSCDAGDSPKKVIESIHFKMQTNSVETNNDDRNKKIAEAFFGTINTKTIEGKIKTLKDNGKAVIEIKMNGISADVEGDYSLDDESFDFTSTIEVSSWNALPGIKALNLLCKELHTGPDNISKLWSVVQLKFSTTLKSDCNK